MPMKEDQKKLSSSEVVAFLTSPPAAFTKISILLKSLIILSLQSFIFPYPLHLYNKLLRLFFSFLSSPINLSALVI